MAQVGLVGLPIVFDRPLRLFAYVFGHSQVLFKGSQDGERGCMTTLEVLFKDVTALSVRDHYPAMTIRTASAMEVEELREAIPGPWHDAVPFVLGERLLGGFVLAGAVCWGESSAPETYDSFLIADHELPRFVPDRPAPTEPRTVYAPYPSSLWPSKRPRG